MQNDLFIKVLAFMRGSDIVPVAACELAPGVVAVLDTMNEVDIYFEKTYCTFTAPELWEQVGCTSSVSPDIGVLQGVGRFPPVQRLEDAVGFAERNLSFQTKRSWHNVPLPLSVPLA